VDDQARSDDIASLQLTVKAVTMPPSGQTQMSDDIPRIGSGDRIVSPANELDAAHRLLDREPNVIPRDQALDLSTRIMCLLGENETLREFLAEATELMVALARDTPHTTDVLALEALMYAWLGWTQDEIDEMQRDRESPDGGLRELPERIRLGWELLGERGHPAPQR
jgi:hypothetical protein